MGHIDTLSRRAFVFGSAAIAGGIAFGAYGRAEAATPAPMATRSPQAFRRTR